MQGFAVPEKWDAPILKWKTTVGPGYATPALVGSGLFVFSRQPEEEVLMRLDAENGSIVWKHPYKARPVTGAAEEYQGPRSSPAVIQNKLIAVGVGGTVVCLEAETGKSVWQRDDFTNAVPDFFVSMSPLIAESLCVVHLGGKENGVVAAIDVKSGGLQVGMAR